MAQAPTIAVQTCERLIASATSGCAAAPPQIVQIPAQPVGPNFDALAASFSALSTGFAQAQVLLALIALAFGIAWGVAVKFWAEREARAEARAVMAAWLADEAPKLIRDGRSLIGDGPTNETNAKKADDIGIAAG